MPEQLSLVPAPPAAPRRRRPAPASDAPLAERDPVAQVLIDTPLAHLDRPFEYAVPAPLDEDARPGCRVRVRFSGRDHDGILLARTATAEHEGRLAPLRTVVSPEPVLTTAVAAELRLVADHYGGTAADVLRLAVPPRHARAERTVPPEASDEVSGGQEAPVERSRVPADRQDAAGPWAAYPAGPALLRRLAAGEAPAAAWLALPRQPPETDWPAAIAAAVRATAASGRGSLVVVPDRRDVDRVLPVLTQALGSETVVRLTADLGPEARYRAFLKVLRGHVQVVVGTRAAAFAPVRDLGLLVCWDEGDDLHQEPRAPYPHVREVLRLRAGQEGAALLVGGLTRSVTVQSWVEAGAVATVVAAPTQVRSAAPRVVVAGEGLAEERDAAARTARIPSLAWRTLKKGLEVGPVLVQVPRQGYVVALACQDCRAPVRCAVCQGPVGVTGQPPAAVCRWCGTGAAGGRCRQCGSPRRRATALGERRTAEELGRAFPGTRVVSSGGQHVVPEVDAEPALVVATPGAEPWCPTGYAAVVLLDGWRLLERPSLDAAPEALRRWSTAAAGAAPAAGGHPLAGGGSAQVVLCGVPPHGSVPAVEALVRWDPAWLAARELTERRELGLPPVRRHATVVGPPAAVQEAVTAISQDGTVELVGVVEVAPERDAAQGRSAGGTGHRPRAVATVREPGGPGDALPQAVHAVRAARSARKAEDPVRIMLDATEAPG
ncbi:primosome assembly protein PriA [Ornithinimicrobium sufpigmenti]|uniref:primosomal protein N' family DNA-binding protein n=1 Tax=Ornithinimicrobium sufpigmenti TaxID=2508882 RepID=UPI0015E1A24A|nr:MULTISPECIES: primosome assembly protein PriA [unclassified Ornithinimicrobium]